MSWVAVGVGAVSTIGGLFGSSSAKKAQKEANKIARDTLKFNKERYADYQNQYGGLIDLVVSDAEKGVQADLGRVTSEANADTATAFTNAKQALDNQNQRLGINPNSGRAESSNRQLALNQAVATAGNVTNARNKERQFADEATWNRRYGVYQQGNSMLNSAASNVSSSMSSLADSYQTSANNQSNLANQAIAGGVSSITQGLLKDTSLLKNLFGGTTTTQPVSTIDTATKGMKVAGTQVGSGVMYDNIASLQQPKANNGSFIG
ncbi:hypothetical protein KTJ53_15400 [Acinetobacter variabilis]|uniref:hypothetical protein n=1 Tax=Acinetobacter variabilis TaxID=70346 RepID=UPI0021D0E627|nr:hypothetical protein [Acinetobacter variabilis]MCU4631027.1 hypothetical protein [Acinetobacter variabilis]